MEINGVKMTPEAMVNLAQEWAAKQEAADAERQRQEQARWAAMSESEKAQVLEERRRQEEIAWRHENEKLGIPPRYYNATWENFSADTKEKRNALKAVRDNAWFENTLLRGGNGTGKTHIAMCLVRDGATYIRVSDLFRQARSGEQDMLEKYGRVKLLILDEIGRQRFSDFELNFMFDLLDTRYEYCVPTMCITNLAVEAFVENIGIAVMDRLRPRVIDFNWESYRGKA